MAMASAGLMSPSPLFTDGGWRLNSIATDYAVTLHLIRPDGTTPLTGITRAIALTDGYWVAELVTTGDTIHRLCQPTKSIDTAVAVAGAYLMRHVFTSKV